MDRQDAVYVHTTGTKRGMLVRLWGQGNPQALWEVMQTGEATEKAAWSFLKKLKMALLHNPAIPTLGIYLKKIKF